MNGFDCPIHMTVHEEPCKFIHRERVDDGFEYFVHEDYHAGCQQCAQWKIDEEKPDEN